MPRLSVITKYIQVMGSKRWFLVENDDKLWVMGFERYGSKWPGGRGLVTGVRLYLGGTRLLALSLGSPASGTISYVFQAG